MQHIGPKKGSTVQIKLKVTKWEAKDQLQSAKNKNTKTRTTRLPLRRNENPRSNDTTRAMAIYQLPLDFHPLLQKNTSFISKNSNFYVLRKPKYELHCNVIFGSDLWKEDWKCLRL